MKKCLVWGMGTVFKDYVTALKYYELSKQLTVVNITSNSNIYRELFGYSYISKADIDSDNYDFVIIMAQGPVYNDIKNEVIASGFDESQIVPYFVLKNPIFEINKYLRILQNKPTIFANNCWGGFMYHSLGIKFYSPFINLYLHDEDYLKFLGNPKFYINQEIEFYKTSWSVNLNKEFPVGKCGDIFIYFNHYDCFEDAKNAWNRRKERINWNNILVMLSTEEKSSEEQFNAINYPKKICFVPYETTLKNSVKLDLSSKEDFRYTMFGHVVNHITNSYPFYDPFELLDTGKFVKVVKT